MGEAQCNEGLLYSLKKHAEACFKKHNFGEKGNQSISVMGKGCIKYSVMVFLGTEMRVLVLYSFFKTLLSVHPWLTSVTGCFLLYWFVLLSNCANIGLLPNKWLAASFFFISIFFLYHQTCDPGPVVLDVLPADPIAQLHRCFCRKLLERAVHTLIQPQSDSKADKHQSDSG